jgi:hypothetical protein
MILSGFKQNELYTLMSAYRKADLPRQLWATITPVSEDWTLANLLEELAAEDRVRSQKAPSKGVEPEAS